MLFQTLFLLNLLLLKFHRFLHRLARRLRHAERRRFSLAGYGRHTQRRFQRAERHE